MSLTSFNRARRQAAKKEAAEKQALDDTVLIEPEKPKSKLKPQKQNDSDTATE
jgi:hypothetical protein